MAAMSAALTLTSPSTKSSRLTTGFFSHAIRDARNSSLCLPHNILFKWTRAKKTIMNSSPTDEDMMNIGLDDVFNLLDKASEFDPSPEDLTAPETNRNLKSTPFSRWYKVYGRSVPTNVDSRTLFYGPNRPLWKGAQTTPSDVPGYLKGEYPGDYGCDIFGFCKTKEGFELLREQEVLNGRWAMLGVVGCLFPELFFSPTATFEPVWFKAGAQIFSESGIDYLNNPQLIDAHSIGAVAAVQAVLLGGAELLRWNAKKNGQKDVVYPGGSFDPLGLANDSESFAELRVKEIKNARLAMVAMAGLFAQGALTGEGPINNLTTFLNL